MNLAENMQFVSDLAVVQFPATIGAVSGIVPVQLVQRTTANSADFDYLAAVANHIYYLESVALTEVVVITGLPLLMAYNLAASAERLLGINVNPGQQVAQNFFCTRLAHLLNGATTGSYSIVYNGFDLTYTGP